MTNKTPETKTIRDMIEDSLVAWPTRENAHVLATSIERMNDAIDFISHGPDSAEKAALRPLQDALCDAAMWLQGQDAEDILKEEEEENWRDYVKFVNDRTFREPLGQVKVLHFNAELYRGA